MTLWDTEVGWKVQCLLTEIKFCILVFFSPEGWAWSFRMIHEQCTTSVSDFSLFSTHFKLTLFEECISVILGLEYQHILMKIRKGTKSIIGLISPGFPGIGLDILLDLLYFRRPLSFWVVLVYLEICPVLRLQSRKQHFFSYKIFVRCLGQTIYLPACYFAIMCNNYA